MIHPKKQNGFSLIEVMVALIVLSVGLLGMAALQSYSIRNNQSANYRTHAVNIGYQVLDIVKGYRGATASTGAGGASHRNVREFIRGLGGNGSWRRLGEDTSGYPDAAVAITSCQGAAFMECDRDRIFRAMRMLPDPRIRVTFAELPEATVTVEVCWNDDRSLDEVNDACTGAAQGLGQRSLGPDGVTLWENNAVWLRSRI